MIKEPLVQQLMNEPYIIIVISNGSASAIDQNGEGSTVQVSPVMQGKDIWLAILIYILS